MYAHVDCISHNVAVEFVIQELFNKYVDGLSYLLVYVNTTGDPTQKAQMHTALTFQLHNRGTNNFLQKTTVSIIFVRISNMIRQHGDTAI